MKKELVDEEVEQEEIEQEEVVSDTPEKTKNTRLKHRTKLSNFLKTKKGKVLAVILGIIVVAAILFAIPFTRYGLLGPIVKKDVTLTVVDSKTKQPVSNALVKVGGISKQTDKDGVVKLTGVPVNQSGVEVTKKFYTTLNHAYTVPVIFSPDSSKFEITATGRPVTVTVYNKITGKVLDDAVITAGETKATTDSSGVADLVLSPTEDTQSATITKDGYNSQDVELIVSEGADIRYDLTPSGSIYYLSNATGAVDVMKSNLDGTNPSVAVKATGEETAYRVTLFTSRDWKYAVLLSDRSDKQLKPYLVDDKKADFTLMDEENATFTAVGWSGHNFVYTVERKSTYPWENKRFAVKVYNAETRKVSVVDETIGQQKPNESNQNPNDNDHSSYEVLSSAYIFNGEVVYAKHWQLGFYAGLESSDKYPTSFMRVNISSLTKKTVKTFIHTRDMIEVRPNGLKGIYAKVPHDDQTDPTYYEYKGQSLDEVKNIGLDTFYGFRGNYILSPSGTKTLSYEYRDGKNAIMVGDSVGENSKVLGSVENSYFPIGWFGQNDEYILLSGPGNELFIAPSKDDLSNGDIQKVVSFYSPVVYGSY